MNWNLLKRSLLVLTLTGLGILLIHRSSHAIQFEGTLDIERIQPSLELESYCGNGITEEGEACDHGESNGGEGDLCQAHCTYNIPEGQEDCVQEYAVDCYREKKSEYYGIDGLQIRRVNDEERLILQGFRQECVEAGIRLCSPEEDLDSVDLSFGDENDENQNFAGGCSLGLGSTAANGWQILLGLGFLLPFKRRR
jgi:hypothetical protein